MSANVLCTFFLTIRLSANFGKGLITKLIRVENKNGIPLWRNRAQMATDLA